jgi:hypothetical protein
MPSSREKVPSDAGEYQKQTLEGRVTSIGKKKKKKKKSGKIE